MLHTKKTRLIASRCSSLLIVYYFLGAEARVLSILGSLHYTTVLLGTSEAVYEIVAFQ